MHHYITKDPGVLGIQEYAGGEGNREKRYIFFRWRQTSLVTRHSLLTNYKGRMSTTLNVRINFNLQCLRSNNSHKNKFLAKSSINLLKISGRNCFLVRYQSLLSIAYTNIDFMICFILRWLKMISYYHTRRQKCQYETRGPGALYRAQEYHCNLVLFSFKYMKREKGRDLTHYTNLCGLNILPH